MVLWEMLTGKRLFQGRTLSDVLAAVIRDEPDLSQAPAKVRPLLKRCLEKDPRRRLRDIGDAMAIIENTPEIKVGLAILSPGGWAVAAALALALFVLSMWAPWRAKRRLKRGQFSFKSARRRELLFALGWPGVARSHPMAG